MGAMSRLMARPIAPDEAIRGLLLSHLDARRIWDQVCALPEHDAAPVIACCEMAFARAAIIRHLIMTLQPPHIAIDMCSVLDRHLAAAFDSPGDEETLAFYGGTLRDSLPETFGLYVAAAHHAVGLTGLLIERIGGDLTHTVSASESFRRFGDGVAAELRAVRLRPVR